MRDFLLNSEELLDQKAYEFLQTGEDKGLLPCTRVNYNDRIKLVYFTDHCTPFSKLLPDMQLDEVCDLGRKLLKKAEELEQYEEIALENAVWDLESIYVDEEDQLKLICIPALLPGEGADREIYIKRMYALLEEMLAGKEGGDEVCRQIEFQKERQFGNWESLQDAMTRRRPEEEENILLRSINTPQTLTFHIGHETFVIGTDPYHADGLISGVDTVSPIHAEIGWNDISFYVVDRGSSNGTFVNDQKIAPNVEVPIGQGTVLRFADCTFSVE